MNATRKLLPLILFPALFSADINLAQAADLSIYKAVWRNAKDKLVIKGQGEPGAQVNAFVANSILPVGSATVDKRGIWRIKQVAPPFVPCEVDVVSGVDSANAVIARAPGDCFVAGEDPDPDPTPENTPPVISGSPSTQVAEGQAYSFRPSASDADNDSLSFSIANRPTWASFSSSTGQLSGTPDMDDAGTTSNIRISVSDGTDTISLNAFSITVNGTNQAPTISGSPATSVAEGGSYRFAPSADDADGDSLSFSIANRPSWASFNTSTGVLSGTPGMDDAGTTSNIRISVSDGSATASLSAFSITVSDTNRAPTISGAPATSLDEGSAYSFTPTASDPDGDALSFSVSNPPSWASFNSSTGQLSGTPDSNSAGSYS
ncbi:MAG: putative Ig domain-containing protein, partial [Candidatus Thiodiazotropha lotti]